MTRMRRLLPVLLLPVLLLPVLLLPVQAQVPLRTAKLVLTSVADWQRGASEGLLISNNESGAAGGEARLLDGGTAGEFVSAALPISDTAGLFAATAVGASWQAALPAGTVLDLAVRGGPGPGGPWNDWQPLTAGDTRSGDGKSFVAEGVRVLPLDTTFVQLRATFGSDEQGASAILSAATLYAYNALEGPASAVGFNRAPIAYGPATLTARPTLVRRNEWGTEVPVVSTTLALPRAIVLHLTGTPTDDEALATTGQPLMVLRALAAYQSTALGWGDMGYHYIIDREGNLYEGRLGGPESVVTQFGGVAEPAVHVALLGGDDETPSAEVRLTLARLIAWLGQAYDLPPLGEHQARLAGGGTETRPNLVTHAAVSPGVADEATALEALLPELRAEADEATVRSRFYFPEGNTERYEQRMALFNPGEAATTARMVLLQADGPPLVQEVGVEPGARADFVVSEGFGVLRDAPLVVEASQQLVAERVMRRTTNVDGADVAEIDGSRGMESLSRLWYFAEGSTDGGFETYFALLNPQTTAVSATLTYMRGDGITATQEVSIPPLARTVVVASNVVKGFGFGTRVLASQPIAAERTMIFGSGGQGFHTGPGQATLSRRWLFAEGTTAAPFAMRVLLLNPTTLTNTAELTFATADGTSTRRKYALPPTSRLVVNVNDVVPELGVATTVDADRPLIAERALYFNSGNAGSVAAGVREPAYVWRFAEGRTTEGDQMFLLVSNPGKGQARVSIDFLLEDGGRETQGFLMPGGSRYTLAVHEFYPSQNALAATVRSSQPVVVERSLYRAGLSSGYTIAGAPAAN